VQSRVGRVFGNALTQVEIGNVLWSMHANPRQSTGDLLNHSAAQHAVTVTAPLPPTCPAQRTCARSRPAVLLPLVDQQYNIILRVKVSPGRQRGQW
jgi:hypothetical protein